MSYRKNQGRYARMIAFWSVALLIGYGFFRGGGLIDMMARWMGGSDGTLVSSFPLLGELKLSSMVTMAIYAIIVFVLSLILRQPKLADLLIETEAEMQKVTWPGWSEVAQGTMAVTAMVAVLFLFLTGIDLILTQAIDMIMPGGGGGNG